MTQIRILFVCHGNICRSPMAEFVMRDLVEKKGLSKYFEISSAATSTEELGNPVHHGTRRKLAQVGIDCSGKTARQIVKTDYEKHDYLIGMDEANVRNMRRHWKSDPEGKIYKLLEFAGSYGDIADPWYTGNFEETYEDVMDGCVGLLGHLGY